MQTTKKVMGAGSEWRQGSFGRYFGLLETGAPVTVRLMNGGRVTYEATEVESGFYTVPDEGFDEFQILSNYNQLVKVGVSRSMNAGYNRVGGSVDAKLVTAQNLLNTPKVDIPAGGAEVLLVPANPARAALRLFNAGAKDVWIGAAGLNLVNACVKIAAGELWVEEVAAGAAWVGLCAVADNSTIKIQEITY